MARQYSIREFFRQMPNILLARFFQEQGLFTNLDFTSMKETNPDELFNAWIALPEQDRKAMDATLQEVFELSCEKGFKAIIDEATWQMRTEPDKLNQFIADLAVLPNHYHRTMITYLDYPECWKGATRFYHADTLNYWRKRKNMGHNCAAVDADNINQLANLICHYFHRTEGRGNNCVVEVFRRADLDYFFAYPEDYSQQSIEWVEGEFARRPHNPAFEIIFIYSQKKGKLDIHFYGPHKVIEALQAMFSSVILKLDELPPDPKDDRIYDLSFLCNRNFNFTYKTGSGIEAVAIRKIRFSSRIIRGNRIILEADVYQNEFALYDQIEKIGRSVPLDLYNVTQVELVATVKVDINKPPKRIPIRLTHPNSCSLKYDDIGLKLREMLEASGIEPKEPIAEIQAEELEKV